MRKILLSMSTLLILFLSGCNTDIKELRESVSTINTEVKRTNSLYEESLKVAEDLNTEMESVIDTQTYLSESFELEKELNPHLEGLYSFYNSYVEEIASYNIMPKADDLEEPTEDLSIQVESLSDYTDVRYYYDDVSNILEQMYITTLPKGSTFMISLEWYKGELIRYEEMVSY